MGGSMWLFQGEQSRGHAENFRSSVVGGQADSSLWLHTPHTDTYLLHRSVPWDCARSWGHGRWTRQTWVLHSWSFKPSWADEPQITRQLGSLIITVVNAIKSCRIHWGSDERNRLKTGELTCLPSWTVFKLKPEFQSLMCQFTAVPAVPQLGLQCLNRSLGEVTSTKTTVVAPSLQLPQRNKNMNLKTSLSSWTLAHAL